MRISDIKKAEIASADNMDSVWYITKQNQSFADLCYIRTFWRIGITMSLKTTNLFLIAAKRNKNMAL